MKASDVVRIWLMPTLIVMPLLMGGCPEVVSDGGQSNDDTGKRVPSLLSLTATAQGEGTVDPATGSFESGTYVPIRATPAEGSRFDHWEGDLTGNINPATIVMDAQKSITAVFVVAPQRTLVIAVSPPGSGTVARTPDQATYQDGTSVTLAPQPAEGFAFSHWEGDLGGTANPATLVMNASQSVTAVFVPAVSGEYALTVSASPAGAGSVTSSPNQAAYRRGEKVTLAATANPGYGFDRWTGDADGNVNPLSLTMDGAKNVTAVFVVSGGGGASLPQSPRDGFWSGMTSQGQAISFTVSAGGTAIGDFDIRYRFEGTFCSYDGHSSWTGVDAITSRTFSVWSGLADDISITVSGTFFGQTAASGEAEVADLYCLGTETVTWTAQCVWRPMLTTSAVPAGAGTVERSPAQTTYDTGTLVVLTASASPGFVFDHWEGNASGSANPVTIAMDTDKWVTAVFSSSCNVAFCKQVDHYEDGTSGLDTITVDCVQGPSGATVSNAKNGEYVVYGTYKLGTRITAIISLEWGGETSYSPRGTYTISAQGSGSFSFRTTKISGGSGNMFVRMSSGEDVLLDSVLVNDACSSRSFRLLAGTGSGGLHPFSLVELETDPVSEVLVGPASYNPGLDRSPNGVLYGASSSLRTINPATGATTTIGTIRSATKSSIIMSSIAFAPNGTLYGTDEQILYTINPTTGFATEVATIPVYVWGIDFAPDGTLYGAEFDLFVLDPYTGQVVANRGHIPYANGVNDIDFAPDGFIYAVAWDGKKLFRIDPSDASTATEYGAYGSELWGIASETLLLPTARLAVSQMAVSATDARDPSTEDEAELVRAVRQHREEQKQSAAANGSHAVSPNGQ